MTQEAPRPTPPEQAYFAQMVAALSWLWHAPDGDEASIDNAMVCLEGVPIPALRKLGEVADTLSLLAFDQAAPRQARPAATSHTRALDAHVHVTDPDGEPLL